jgi:hypothetical protein
VSGFQDDGLHPGQFGQIKGLRVADSANPAHGNFGVIVENQAAGVQIDDQVWVALCEPVKKAQGALMFFVQKMLASSERFLKE